MLPGTLSPVGGRPLDSVDAGGNFFYFHALSLMQGELAWPLLLPLASSMKFARCKFIICPSGSHLWVKLAAVEIWSSVIRSQKAGGSKLVEGMTSCSDSRVTLVLWSMVTLSQVISPAISGRFESPAMGVRHQLHTFFHCIATFFINKSRSRAPNAITWPSYPRSLCTMLLPTFRIALLLSLILPILNLFASSGAVSSLVMGLILHTRAKLCSTFWPLSVDCRNISGILNFSHTNYPIRFIVGEWSDTR